MSKIVFVQKSSPNTLRLGLVFRRLRKRQAKACRHRPTPSYYEGPNGVFRSVGSSDTPSPYETLPGIDSRSPSPRSADPSVRTARMQTFQGLQWAVTPK